MFFIRNGVNKFTGLWLEDHVDPRKENQINRFFGALNVEGNIERAIFHLGSRKTKKEEAEKKFSQVSYISSLKKEKEKYAKEIQQHAERISFLENYIHELSHLHEKESFEEKLKILEELKVIRVN